MAGNKYYYNSAATPLTWGLALERTFVGPLDKWSVYSTYADVVGTLDNPGCDPFLYKGEVFSIVADTTESNNGVWYVEDIITSPTEKDSEGNPLRTATIVKIGETSTPGKFRGNASVGVSGEQNVLYPDQAGLALATEGDWFKVKLSDGEYSYEIPYIAGSTFANTSKADDVVYNDSKLVIDYKSTQGGITYYTYHIDNSEVFALLEEICYNLTYSDGYRLNSVSSAQWSEKPAKFFAIQVGSSMPIENQDSEVSNIYIGNTGAVTIQILEDGAWVTPTNKYFVDRKNHILLAYYTNNNSSRQLRIIDTGTSTTTEPTAEYDASIEFDDSHPVQKITSLTIYNQANTAVDKSRILGLTDTGAFGQSSTYGIQPNDWTNPTSDFKLNISADNYDINPGVYEAKLSHIEHDSNTDYYNFVCDLGSKYLFISYSNSETLTQINGVLVNKVLNVGTKFMCGDEHFSANLKDMGSAIQTRLENFLLKFQNIKIRLVDKTDSTAQTHNLGSGNNNTKKISWTCAEYETIGSDKFFTFYK